MPLSTLDTLRATVAALTHATGESQAVLAAGIGLTQSQISRRQSGPSAWTLDDVDALAAHWGIPVLELLAGPSRACEALPADRHKTTSSARTPMPTPAQHSQAALPPPSLAPEDANASQTATPDPAARIPQTTTQPAAPQARTAPQEAAPPDRLPDGAAVMSGPEPCVLCGHPTPYRAAGDPQHLHGMCQTANTAEREAAPATPQPPSPAATPRRPARSPAARRDREVGSDLLDRITHTVTEQLDQHGGDIEEATVALVKRAIPDAMALLDACRVGSRYEYTAYPPLPPIVKKKSRSGPDQIWEGRPKWHHPAFTRKAGGPQQTVTVLDMNGAYLSALKTHLPIGQLKHDPTGTWDPKKSGLYLVTPPTWDHPGLPNPIGDRDEPGPLWLTDPTVRLLLRLSSPTYGLCEPPVIHEAWTAHSTENILEKFRQTLAAARDAAIADNDNVTLEYVKAMYSKFVSTIGESGANHQLRRPDWMHLIRAQAFTNLWLKGHKAHRAGLTVVQMAGTDELHVIGDWHPVFTEGRKLSDVKTKRHYTIGGDH